jgi:hypothetical protein
MLRLLTTLNAYKRRNDEEVQVREQRVFNGGHSLAVHHCSRTICVGGNVRGIAYDKIEYVKIRAYLKKYIIRVLYISLTVHVCNNDDPE